MLGQYVGLGLGFCKPTSSTMLNMCLTAKLLENLELYSELAGFSFGFSLQINNGK